METTKEEYAVMYNRIKNRMEYTNSIITDEEHITQLVDKHFSIFLNDAEESAIVELILQNFKENHGYTGEGKLPNGNLLCWEIQVIACDFSNKTIRENHFARWYSPKYCIQIINIIGSKKL